MKNKGLSQRDQDKPLETRNRFARITAAVREAAVL